MIEAAPIRVERFGIEAEPVILIEAALDDPHAFVKAAAGLAFAPDGPFFPGPRARAPEAYQAEVFEKVGPVVRETFGLELSTMEANSFFSIVATPPERLLPIQRLPHFDGIERERLAMIHYLCRPEHGGTAFYRHRSTGFETVDAARFPAYRAALEADVAREGLPTARYLNGDTALFERIGGYDAAFNRLLIYRGFRLHSGSIPANFTCDPDPRSGRLTVNTFLAPRG